MLALPQFIGHRGVKGLAPENTLASFCKAGQLGFKWVEFDVMLAACGEPVVFHDHLLGRTTNGRGRLVKKTFEQLSQLDAGSWFSLDFQQEAIPSLTATLHCLAEHGLQANIEIKPNRGQELLTAEKVVEQVAQYWPAEFALPLVSSFSLASLLRAKTLMPKLPLGMLYNKLPRNWQKSADELACLSIHLNQQHVNLKQISAIKKTGRQVLTYTVNELARADLLFSWGVDGVFTDYPLFAAHRE